MINNVLVSGVQQSDSVIHIHVSILFQILFPFRLLQSIEQSSQSPNLSLPPTPGHSDFIHSEIGRLFFFFLIAGELHDPVCILLKLT